MSGERDNDMVDEELVQPGVGGEVGSTKVSPAPDSTATTGEKTMESDAGSTKTTSRFPLFLVLVSSIVLLVATGAFYDWNIIEIGGFAGYAITVSFVGLALSLFSLIFAKIGGKLSKFGHYLNMLNLIYSFLGACFLTFREPFTATGNGYFAAWTMVFGCAMSLGMSADAFGSTIKGLGSILGLLVSSVVVLIACATFVDDEEKTGEVVYAFIIAAVTAVFLLCLIAMDKMTKMKMPGMLNYLVFGLLAGCWIIEACLVTFRGPFEITGNGYFGSWAGAITSSMAAFDALNAM